MLVSDCVEYYLAEAESRQQRLTAHASAHRILVEGDRDLLFQAFANILDNAVKFTPIGGKINAKVCLRDGRPTVVVSDSGPGVAVGSLQRLGERFYKTPVGPAHGTGLGLTLVAAVARSHGAVVDFHSEGCGLDVVFTFQTAVASKSSTS